MFPYEHQVRRCVRPIIRALCPRESEWEDLEQDSVIATWQDWQKKGQPDLVPTLAAARTIAERVCINFYKRKYPRLSDIQSLDEPRGTAEAEESVTLEDIIGGKGLDPEGQAAIRDALQRAFAALPENQQVRARALILYEIRGWAYQEIADDYFGVPVGTVKSWINRIKQILQDLLADSFPELAA